MKTSLIIPKIKQAINVRNIEKADKEIAKYVKIHNNTTYGDSFQQMSQASSCIANYAKSKGVRVDVYDARKVLDNADDVSASVKNNLSDKLRVVVSDIVNNTIKKERFVSANTNATTTHLTKETFILPSRNGKNAAESYNVTSFQEDNFLRNLYRNIEDMANQIHPNKK